VLRLLVTPRWLVRHLLLAAALVVCWEFGSWQLGRALDRDSVLNWSYTLEWFLFGGFAVLTWGWFLRDELRGRPEEPEPDRPPVAARPAPPPVTDDEDPELAAYNRMLAELHRKEAR
jgi:hypothetical protein